MNWIQRLVKGTLARVEHTVENIAWLFRGKPDESAPVEPPPPVEPISYPQEVFDPEDFTPTEPDTGQPEEEPEDWEEDRFQNEVDSDSGLEVIESSKDTRGPFATFSEAVSYAEEIPVPTTVGKTPYGLYIVRIDYP